MLDNMDNLADSTDKQDMATEDELPRIPDQESAPPEEPTDTVTIFQEDLTKVIVTKIK